MEMVISKAKKLLEGVAFLHIGLILITVQVKDRLSQAGNPTVRLKLSHLLEAAQRGLAQNPTITPENTLIFVSGILETVVTAEVAAAKKAVAAAEAASRGEGMARTMSFPWSPSPKDLFDRFARLQSFQERREIALKEQLMIQETSERSNRDNSAV